MITRNEFESAQKRAAKMIGDAGFVLSDAETSAIEVVDFGLSRLEEEGAQILTLTQTERISIKLLALFPNQTEPEHWHSPSKDDPGKEETIRVLSGQLLFYIRMKTHRARQRSPQAGKPSTRAIRRSS